MDKLERGFYLRDTVTVARELLGKRIVRVLGGEELVVEITETEAYTGVGDKACHSYGDRRTPRTEVLYGEGGHAYVYLIYGMYHMLNVVTEAKGVPCAVLIRGAKPVQGQDAMARLRFGKDYGELPPSRKRALLDGPGKLCRGLALDMGHNKLDLLGGELYLTQGTPLWELEVGVGKRIGIDYAQEAVDFPYRFYTPPSMK